MKLYVIYYLENGKTQINYDYITVSNHESLFKIIVVVLRQTPQRNVYDFLKQKISNSTHKPFLYFYLYLHRQKENIIFLLHIFAIFRHTQHKSCLNGKIERTGHNIIINIKLLVIIIRKTKRKHKHNTAVSFRLIINKQ